MTTAAEPITEPNPDAALAEITSKVVAEINSGSMTFADLLKAVAPQQVSASLPAKVATPKPITDKQREVISNLDKVYGQVVPTEPRIIQPVEAEALVMEKQHLDVLKKMAEDRLEDIKATVHNHLDVQVDSSLNEGDEPPLRDKNGHYISEGRLGGPGVEQEFVRGERTYAASLSVEALQNAEALGMITHAQFLSMTEPVRVVDEAAVLKALKKDPSLIKAIAFATTPGSKGTAITLSKRK